MNFTVTGFAPAGVNGPSWVLPGSNGVAHFAFR